ncbi:redoxin domain-containing protein [bacterium]|nr:redoxin domain-containing protein [bacterium]
MQEYYDEIRQYNAKILSISVKSPDVAKIIVDAFQLEYPILCDVQKEVIPQYCVLNPTGTNVIPSVFIIDMWGIIRWKHVDDGTGIVSGPTIIEKLHEVPLAVTFASLTAFSATDSITIKWSTETEIDNLGFNIYRSETKDGKYIKVNSKLIQSTVTDSFSHDYSYTDDNLKFGQTYYYYIEYVDFSGKKDKSPLFQITVGRKSDVKVISKPNITIRPKLNPIPIEFALLQNYPNPFNPETWIPFQLAQDMSVTIKIYAPRGQLVRTIALGHRQAGIYLTKDRAAYWDGKDSFGEKVGSGVYFYTLQSSEANLNTPASQFQVSRKMVMMK